MGALGRPPRSSAANAGAEDSVVIEAIHRQRAAIKGARRARVPQGSQGACDVEGGSGTRVNDGPNRGVQPPARGAVPGARRGVSGVARRSFPSKHPAVGRDAVTVASAADVNQLDRVVSLAPTTALTDVVGTKVASAGGDAVADSLRPPKPS